MNKTRVLYVGHTLLGDDEATGQTLNNMFSHCYNVELLQYCLDYTKEYHTTEVKTIYIDEKKSFPFSLIKKAYRKRLAQNEKVSFQAINNNSHIGHKENPIRAFLKGFLDILPKKMSKDNLKIIDTFSPDVIYTLGESISAFNASLKLSKKYDVPIVWHIMDDNETCIYNYTKATTCFRKKYINLIKKARERMVYGLAIGTKMAKEFSLRYNMPFDFAMNCLDELHEQPLPNNDKLKFLFSGGMHGGRAETLSMMADIINGDEALRKNIDFAIYSSPNNVKKYASMFKDKCCLYEYVPKDQMFENLGKADILVHVESFEQSEIDFFRYSMSTKIPECLSVGRPILCYGPKEICTVSYIDEKKVGIVADNQEKLIESINLLVADEKLRDDLSKNALKVAENEHLSTAVAARIENVFEKSEKMWRENNA